jgi:hypothetical protein
MINCQKVSILNRENQIPETFRNPYLETLDKNLKIPKDLTLPTEQNISSMNNKELHTKLPTNHKNLSNSKAITLPRSDKHNLMKNMDLSLPTSKTDQSILETSQITIPLGKEDEKLIYPNQNSQDPKVLETKGKEILKTQMIEPQTKDQINKKNQIVMEENYTALESSIIESLPEKSILSTNVIKINKKEKNFLKKLSSLFSFRSCLQPKKFYYSSQPSFCNNTMQNKSITPAHLMNESRYSTSSVQTYSTQPSQPQENWTVGMKISTHSTSPVQQTQIQSPNFHYPSDLKSELEDSHSDLLTPLLKSAQQKK